MREFDWIERLRGRLGGSSLARLGIGDDAAWLCDARLDLVTVDAMVEGVHWSPAWSSGADVGRKLLHRNASDIGAMGGEPGPYVLSASVGPGASADFLDGLLEGLEEGGRLLAGGRAERRVGVIGGDTSRSPGPTVLSMTMLGSSPPRGPVRRDGARPGDVLFLVGPVGLAAAGLAVCQRGMRGEPRWDKLVRAHQVPGDRAAVGHALGLRGWARAMVDVSDGVLQDLGHVLRGSGCGATLDAEAVPLDPAALECAQALGEDALGWALRGGDDYALLVAVPPEKLANVRALCEDLGELGAVLGRFEEATLGLRGADGRPWRLGGHEHTLGEHGERA